MTRESDFTPLFTLPRWSFGLRQLFLWTAAVALGLVALRSASTTWVAAMLALTAAALTMSLLLLIFRRGSKRAYWIGFAICGWMYLLLLFLSWTLGRNTTNNSPLRAPNLVTQKLSSGAYHWLYDEAFEKYKASVYANSAGGYSGGGDYGADMYGVEDSGYGMMSGGMPGMSGSTMRPRPAAPLGPPPGPNIVDFVNVAHSLWALLLAALGGLVAYWLYATGPGRTERPAAA